MPRLRLSSLLTAAAPVMLLACEPDNDPVIPRAATPELSADAEDAAFVTSQPAQAVTLVSGSQLKPIITVGDRLPSGFTWAPTPDGLGAYKEGNDLVVLANHELDGITNNGGSEVFTNSRVSRLVLDPNTLTVKRARYLIGGSEGYQRLCSATWADAAEGFPQGLFLTGEETLDSPHGGIQLAVSSDGRRTELPWLGRFNHENYIAVPGFLGKVVLIGFDDTRGESELYMYVANSPAAVLAGTGKLYVFRTTHAANVRQLHEGQTVQGRFVEIGDAASLSADELQTRVVALGAFPFVRLEDGTYDKRINAPDRPEVLNTGSAEQTLGTRPTIYFVDTGSETTLCGTVPCDPFGSIYRMDFDNERPASNARLTLLQRSRGAGKGWASPDNVAASEHSLMVQEDPAYSGFTRAPRIYKFTLTSDRRLAGRGTAVVALKNNECSEPLGNCWESSGIIDASRWLGAGAWLFDVQAHSKPVPALDLPGESGQLLFLRVPRS